jgi:hypothetical protein
MEFLMAEGSWMHIHKKGAPAGVVSDMLSEMFSEWKAKLSKDDIRNFIVLETGTLNHDNPLVEASDVLTPEGISEFTDFIKQSSNANLLPVLEKGWLGLSTEYKQGLVLSKAEEDIKLASENDHEDLRVYSHQGIKDLPRSALSFVVSGKNILAFEQLPHETIASLKSADLSNEGIKMFLSLNDVVSQAGGSASKYACANYADTVSSSQIFSAFASQDESKTKIEKGPTLLEESEGGLVVSHFAYELDSEGTLNACHRVKFTMELQAGKYTVKQEVDIIGAPKLCKLRVQSGQGFSSGEGGGDSAKIIQQINDNRQFFPPEFQEQFTGGVSTIPEGIDPVGGPPINLSELSELQLSRYIHALALTEPAENSEDGVRITKGLDLLIGNDWELGYGVDAPKVPILAGNVEEYIKFANFGGDAEAARGGLASLSRALSCDPFAFNSAFASSCAAINGFSEEQFNHNCMALLQGVLSKHGVMMKIEGLVTAVKNAEPSDAMQQQDLQQILVLLSDGVNDFLGGSGTTSMDAQQWEFAMSDLKGTLEHSPGLMEKVAQLMIADDAPIKIAEMGNALTTIPGLMEKVAQAMVEKHVNKIVELGTTARIHQEFEGAPPDPEATRKQVVAIRKMVVAAEGGLCDPKSIKGLKPEQQRQFLNAQKEALKEAGSIKANKGGNAAYQEICRRAKKYGGGIGSGQRWSLKVRNASNRDPKKARNQRPGAQITGVSAGEIFGTLDINPLEERVKDVMTKARSSDGLGGAILEAREILSDCNREISRSSGDDNADIGRQVGILLGADDFNAKAFISTDSFSADNECQVNLLLKDGGNRGLTNLADAGLLDGYDNMGRVEASLPKINVDSQAQKAVHDPVLPDTDATADDPGHESGHESGGEGRESPPIQP